MPSGPVDIRSTSPRSFDVAGSPVPSSRQSRNASIARLGSPVPRSHLGTPPVTQVPTPAQIAADGNADLPVLEEQSSLPGPGQSALSHALLESSQRPFTNGGTVSPKPGLGLHDKLPASNYGSFDQRHMAGSPALQPAPVEDPEVVKRHLVQPEHPNGRGFGGSPVRAEGLDIGTGMDEDEFSSLRLQGGDITRQIYRWAEDAGGTLRGRAKRSQSFHVSRPEPEDEAMTRQNILVPGGFRRDFIIRNAESPAPHGHEGGKPLRSVQENAGLPAPRQQSQLFTSNFLEFLTLYGHFAGEELEEDDEDLEPDEYFSSDVWDRYDADGSTHEPGEDSQLLPTPGSVLRRRKHKERSPTGNNSAMNAALLLLKSFVGTGVLFLPRAFLNGGMLFSSLVLLGVALLSFHCFILLVNTRLKVEGSFGDMGGILYGRWMRALILSSIVISQIGFVSAYIVFTSQNLQAFVLAVSKCKSYIDIKFMVLMQLVIFLPLSLIRDISKLGFTALVADAFILLGLLYLYYYDIFTIANVNRGIADIKLFNPSTWTLFIGTAIFTFEGVGLIIPIQESMRAPSQFPKVLGIIMVIITVLFTSIGALSYAAYGSRTKTVVILNMPQDDKMVNGVQFLYSLAILLSTPLQLFPAIRIMENELFTRSGKYNPYIKWQKNTFRFVLVVLCALIAWGGAGDLDKFVSLVGSFACVPLVYVYPPMLHLKAVARRPWERGLDYLVCVIGLVGCVYTTTLTIMQWSGSSGEGSGKGGYCDT